MPTQVDQVVHPINKVFHHLIPHNKLLDMVDPPEDLLVDPLDPQVDLQDIQAKEEVASMVDLPNQQGDTDHPLLDLEVIQAVINSHHKETIPNLDPEDPIKDHHLVRVDLAIQVAPYLPVLF